MIRSNELDLFLPAFRKLQARLKPILKDANNPFFRSKYADLASVYNEVQPIANAEGLSFTQTTDLLPDGSGMVVETIFWHDSGQHLGGIIQLTPAPDKENRVTPQSIGSALTYARRYGLMAVLALPADDDDGNAASGRQAGQATATTKAEKTPAKSKGKAPDKDAPKTPAPSEIVLKYPGKPAGDVTADQIAELIKYAKQGNWMEQMIAGKAECDFFAQLTQAQAADLIGKMVNALGGGK